MRQRRGRQPPRRPSGTRAGGRGRWSGARRAVGRLLRRDRVNLVGRQEDGRADAVSRSGRQVRRCPRASVPLVLGLGELRGEIGQRGFEPGREPPLDLRHGLERDAQHHVRREPSGTTVTDRVTFVRSAVGVSSAMAAPRILPRVVRSSSRPGPRSSISTPTGPLIPRRLATWVPGSTGGNSSRSRAASSRRRRWTTSGRWSTIRLTRCSRATKRYSIVIRPSDPIGKPGL
jgi:hypothetical protein